MSEYQVKGNTPFIRALVADAKNERQDTKVLNDANEYIRKMAEDGSPQSRFFIAQTMAAAITDLQPTVTEFLRAIAHERTIPYGGDKKFRVPMDDIVAYVQAKASTTPRSILSDRSVTVDTVEISARPAVNLYDLKAGVRDMGAMVRDANAAITAKKLARVQQVLVAAVRTLAAPYYASGAGVVKATFDELLLHFRRQGNAVIMGDLAVTDKLREITGFTAGANTTFSGNIIDAFHANGAINSYNGANILPLPNPDMGGSLAFDPAFLYVMNVAGTPEDRNLKVVNEGPVMATEATHIDNLLYEVRLDQLFGAAYLIGAKATAGAYEDTSL